MSSRITPRVLKLEDACRYVGLSAGTFLSGIGREVPPLRMSPGRKGWDRLALDRWIDAHSSENGLKPESSIGPQSETPLDYLLS